MSGLADSGSQEVTDCRRDFLGVRFQREVTGVEEADNCTGNVASECLGTGRQEERIVLTPHGEARASRPSAYAFRCTSSYLIERHRRSMKMLSMKRPRPSIEIATPAASSLPVNAALVNCAP